MKYSTYLLLLILLGGWHTLSAQDRIYRTFKDRHIINMHSVETLPKRKLDVRITHRFGDIAGENGGFKTFYGLENATDVLIGVEYGLSNQLTVGFYRSKGGGTLPSGAQGLGQLLNLTGKYRALYQTEDNAVPVSVSLLGVSSLSTAEAVESEEVIQRFEKFAHRLAYHGQLLVARKFSPLFTLQASGGYTYRNVVPFGDENGIYTVGGATKFQFSKIFGLILEGTFPVASNRNSEAGFYPAIGVGFEIETGGHVFQLNFTNATQIMETDYIPYTTSTWGDGEFRFGFTVSRMFNL